MRSCTFGSQQVNFPGTDFINALVKETNLHVFCFIRALFSCKRHETFHQTFYGRQGPVNGELILQASNGATGFFHSVFHLRLCSDFRKFHPMFIAWAPGPILRPRSKSYEFTQILHHKIPVFK